MAYPFGTCHPLIVIDVIFQSANFNALKASVCALIAISVSNLSALKAPINAIVFVPGPPELDETLSA